MVRRDDWQAGFADRDEAADALADHYAAGRLSTEEFQARLDAAFAARTASELAAVTADLPPGAPSPAPLWAAARRRIPRRRSVARLLFWTASAVLLLFTALVVLAAVIIPHGVLLALVFAVLVLPLLLAALAAVGGGLLYWAARRAWRRGAWLELVPLAAGGPWAARALWLARALLAGRACWRGARRLRRPGGSSPHAGYGHAHGWSWAQARAGGLSGTTR
jgi:uncharacterized integral membrane protein